MSFGVRTDRRIAAVVGGHASTERAINAGVPQGSVLERNGLRKLRLAILLNLVTMTCVREFGFVWVRTHSVRTSALPSILLVFRAVDSVIDRGATC